MNFISSVRYAGTSCSTREINFVFWSNRACILIFCLLIGYYYQRTKFFVTQTNV